MKLILAAVIQQQTGQDMDDLKLKIMQKLAQYVTCIFGGLMLSFETSLDYFIPCLLAVILDVISAYFLGRRVHKKHPDKSDGKFKSEYKLRVIYTMLIVWICIILANYVDIVVRHSTDGLAVRSAVAVFLFYEIWSCLENWSSENEQPIARALQRVMVNKAERHLNVPLSDILLKEESPAGETGRHTTGDGEPPQTILEKDDN